MVDIKITESDVNKIIDRHDLKAYAKKQWNIDLDPKEILYQIELNEVRKYEKLHTMVESMIYNTILELYRKECKKIVWKKKVK